LAVCSLLYFGQYQNLSAVALWLIAFAFTDLFGKSCLGENFNHIKKIKSEYQRRQTDEFLKYCLQLCVSKPETTVNSLLQDVQRHTATAQCEG